MQDYREFLRLLRGEPGRAVIFEPFPDRKTVTQILWRGGTHMWDTTEHRVSTLISFYEYIKSDVAVIEAGDEIGEVLACSHLLPEGMKFVIISDDLQTLKTAEESDSVCALATGLRKMGGFVKPLIHLLRPGQTCAGLREAGFAGVYVPSDAEKYLTELAPVEIAVLGGLGIEYINNSGPLDIYERVTRIYLLRNEDSHKNWAIGTGSFGESAEYLGFISMLGIFNKFI